jgi:type I restriction enzyme S subunit
MGSSDILMADLTHLPYISKKQVAKTPKFLIKKNWVLITRSGTVGRTAYTRCDMDGITCSEHVMRVAPDTDKIKPGYLYAFLSSRFGIPLILSGTYGAIIRHIEPEHITGLPVPRLGKTEDKAHELVQRAADLRVEANNIISQSSLEVEKRFGLWDHSFVDKARIVRHGFSVNSANLRKTWRFEATYHDAIAGEIISRVGKQSFKILSDICIVKKPGMFKRIMADGPDNGYGFIPGSELFTIAPKPIYWVSSKTPNIADCIMSPYWILIQSFGQLDGLICRCILTTRILSGYSATDLQIQLKFKDKYDSGYVFAYLNSRPGYKTIARLPLGGSIPHINPKDIESLIIPWTDKETRKTIGEKILKAWEQRAEAQEFEDQARALVEKAIESGGR